MTASPTPVRILVVANRTASTPMLLDEVRRRAQDGARFMLMIPPEAARGHGEDWTPQDAVGLLERAAGGTVERLDCEPDALDAAHRVVSAGECDELIVSTVPEHLRRWRHHDLPHRLVHLGVATTVIPPEPDAPVDDDLSEGLPTGWTYPPLPGGTSAGAF